jgi:hypothetical protein
VHVVHASFIPYQTWRNKKPPLGPESQEGQNELAAGAVADSSGRPSSADDQDIGPVGVETRDPLIAPALTSYRTPIDHSDLQKGMEGWRSRLP